MKPMASRTSATVFSATSFAASAPFFNTPSRYPSSSTISAYRAWIENPLFARIARLITTLRRERFDVVYDFEFFTRFSAVVTLLSGAREAHERDADLRDRVKSLGLRVQLLHNLRCAVAAIGQMLNATAPCRG